MLPDEVVDHLAETLRAPDLSGTRYEAGEVIGRGGMSTVYRARDRQLQRDVALKVVERPGPDWEGMLREARLLAKLEHPGIVTVHDAGVLSDGRPFCVMQLVEGVALDRFLERGPSLTERLAVIDKVCEAVAFAHSRAIVHRDLKPSNVVVGSFGRVVVLDWGIALDCRENGGAGEIAGTLPYMAPEQRRGAPVDARTDVYALGVLLGEMLPEGAPKPLRAISAKAVTEQPAARYQTVAELAADLERYRERLPVQAYREPVWEAFARYAARNRVLLLLLSAYVLVRVILFFVRPR